MELCKPKIILSVIIVSGLALILIPDPASGEPLASGEYEKDYLKKRIGGEVFILTEEGERLQSEGNYEAARRKFREAYNKALRGGIDLGIAWAAGDLGDLASETGEIADAVTWFSRAAKAAHRDGSLYFEGTYLVDLAWAYKDADKVSMCEETLNQASKILREYANSPQADEKLLVHSQVSLGAAYYMEGRLHLMEGGSYEDRGEYAKAFDEYQSSVRSFEKAGEVGDKLLVGLEQAYGITPEGEKSVSKYEKVAYWSLGSTAYELGKTRKGIDAYEKFLALAEKPGVKADAYRGLAYGYDSIGETAKAKSYYQQAARLYSQTETLDEYSAQAYFNLGCILFDEKNYEKAATWLKKSIKADASAGEEESVAWTQAQLGLCYYHQEKWKKAISPFEKCLARLRSLSIEDSIQDVTTLLSTCRCQASYELKEEGEPTILTECLTHGLDEYDCPKDDVATFLSSDNKALSWVLLEGDVSDHTLTFRFIAPDGSVYYESSDKAYALNWCWISIAGYEAAGMDGEWKVEIELDGSLLATQSFQLEKDTQTLF